MEYFMCEIKNIKNYNDFKIGIKKKKLGVQFVLKILKNNI